MAQSPPFIPKYINISRHVWLNLGPENLFAMAMQIANSPARRDFSSISALQGRIFSNLRLKMFEAKSNLIVCLFLRRCKDKIFYF